MQCGTVSGVIGELRRPIALAVSLVGVAGSSTANIVEGQSGNFDQFSVSKANSAARGLTRGAPFPGVRGDILLPFVSPPSESCSRRRILQQFLRF